MISSAYKNTIVVPTLGKKKTTNSGKTAKGKNTSKGKTESKGKTNNKYIKLSSIK